MDFLELKSPGASVTMLVNAVRRAKSKFGQDYVFLGVAELGVAELGAPEVAVSVPEKATERQMENILKVADVDELVNRFLTISRSVEPGANGKLFWNITYAEQGAFEAMADRPPKLQRVAGPPLEYDAMVSAPRGDDEAFADEMRADAARSRAAFQETRAKGEAGVGRDTAAPTPSPAPAVADPSDTQKRNRVKMAELSRIYHALWEAEAKIQLEVAARLAAQGFELLVTGESVGAAAATQFIQFNMRHLI